MFTLQRQDGSSVTRPRRAYDGGRSALDAHSATSSTISIGGWSASSSPRPTTRRVRWPSGMVSPGLHEHGKALPRRRRSELSWLRSRTRRFLFLH
jgi:hypothetical protein